MVRITITGTNDAPTITAGLTDANGLTQEDLILSDSGVIAFNDVDLIDVHSASVARTSGTLNGSLTLGAVSELATTAPGTVGWTYQVNNASVQYLAAGQSATETFTVTVSDRNGGSTQQLVTVTVWGNNDAPTITLAASDSTGASVEDATATSVLSDSGFIGFNDIDLIDVHTASVSKTTGSLGGSLTLGNVSGEAANTTTGNVAWTYTVPNVATQYLAAGQTATETFTVTVSDGHGGTVDQTVTVTVTGTNDAPVITSSDVTRQIQQGSANLADATLFNITATDVDLTDTLTYELIDDRGYFTRSEEHTSELQSH